MPGRYGFVPKSCVRLLDAKMRVDGPAIFLPLLEFTEAYGKKIESGRERLMETARMRGQVVISAGPTAFCSLRSCPSMGYIVTHTHKITHSVLFLSELSTTVPRTLCFNGVHKIKTITFGNLN